MSSYWLQRFWRNNFHWILFVFLFTIAFSFLIFYRGVWAYLDISWWPKTQVDNDNILKGILNSWRNFKESAFGIDYFYINFQKLFVDFSIYGSNRLFGTDFGQIFFILITSIIGYKSIMLLSKEIFNHKHGYYKIICLLFIFNHTSFNLVAQATIYFSFCFLPLGLYAIIKLIKEYKFRHFLLFIISFFAISAYLRVLFIFAILVLAIVALNYKSVLKKMLTERFKTAVFIVFGCLFLLPFVVSNLFIKLDPSASQYSYIIDSTTFFYERYRSFNYSELITFGEILTNYLRSFSDLNNLLVFVLYGLVVYACSYNNFKFQSQMEKFWVFAGLASLFILTSAKILSETVFEAVTSFLPFVYLNLRWAYLIILMSIVLILSSKVDALSQRARRIIIYFTVIFMLFSSIPALYTGNLLTKKSRINDFFNEDVVASPSVFYPSNRSPIIMRSDEPYPVYNFHNTHYSPIFSNNIRLVSNNLLDLYKMVNFNNILIDNLKIFGVESFVFYKNAVNIPANQFYHPYYDFVNKSKEFQESLSSSKLVTAVESEDYNIYKFEDSNSIDSFIYSPAQVESIVISDLNKKVYDVRTLLLNNLFVDPVLFDNMSTGSKVEYIEYSRNRSKYDLRVTQIEEGKDIVVQLNQAFHERWDLHLSDSSDWGVGCEFEYKSITNNSSCTASGSYVDLSDSKYIFSDALSDDFHFQGNLVGNAYIIPYEQYKNIISDDGAVYATIYFKKQGYHNILLLVIFSSFILLLMLVIIEYVKKK